MTKVSQEARECAWRIFGSGDRFCTKSDYMSGLHDGHPTMEVLAKFEADVLERAARVADGHKAVGYMSDRERDYCHDHGEEIAQAIRNLKGDV